MVFPAAFKLMTTDPIGPGSGVGRDYYFPGDGFGRGYGVAVRVANSNGTAAAEHISASIPNWTWPTS
jgi:hypothetical protein